MKINDTFYISGSHDGKIVTNLRGYRTSYRSGDTDYTLFNNILKVMRKRTISNETKNRMLTRFFEQFLSDETEIQKRLIKVAGTTTTATAGETKAEPKLADHKTLKEFSNKLLKFFSEFQVSISIRFVDTFLRSVDKKAYTLAYFKLEDSPWFNEIATKINSAEFKAILDEAELIKLAPEKQVNKHLKVYFGPAGTGKTTKACEEAEYCIPCSSDMDCKELLKDFKFDASGKPTFEKSVFRLAIEEGNTVVLDEINLLNTQVRQFLQSLTDGKDYVDFEGTKIKIHPNFMAIGTMNLVVNGMTFALSEPLVDRCAEIREYELTGDSIAKALLA